MIPQRDLILLVTSEPVTKADLLRILPRGTAFLRFDLKGEHLNPGTISLMQERSLGFMREFIDKAIAESAAASGVVVGEKDTL